MSESLRDSVPYRWYDIPFPPYAVQKIMMDTIRGGLEEDGSDAKPVLVLEVPTGCGKTLALLSSLLQFQQEVRKKTEKELNTFFDSRRQWNPNNKSASRSNQRKSDRAAYQKEWGPDPEFIKHFCKSISSAGSKRLRSTVDECRSSALRQRFPAPPCTIIYATRTHAQLRQVVRELRRLTACGGTSHRTSVSRRCPLRMNILGSRDHYCINATLQNAKTTGALPRDGNNLGEICDKLVALQQCPCVENYDVLSCSAIDGNGVGFHKGDVVWDIEDLVAEGVQQQKCPYYASRDLIFYADITFSTYPYLLDPIIRHESHLEGALNNNSIIVFDEAHNIPSVCEEALSLESRCSTLNEVIAALGLLVHPGGGMTNVLSYPREFRLSAGHTLVEVFIFLFLTFRAIKIYFKEIAVSGPSDSHSLRYKHGSDIVQRIECAITEWRSRANSDATPSTNGNPKVSTKRECHILFQEAFSIVFSLGVTFNPFDIPLHLLALMKRWLMVLRFLFQKPNAFALHSKEDRDHNGPKSTSNAEGDGELECEIRCLDGSLAFWHLLGSSFKIILASGTLTPFSQLSRSLGVPTSMWRCMEGQHVVPRDQYSIVALTQTAQGNNLRCTFSSLSSESFQIDLGRTILRIIAESMKGGGAIVMVPNYKVLRSLFSAMTKEIEGSSPGSAELRRKLPLSNIFVEPRRPADLQEVLECFKALTKRSLAVLIGVYRGKSGEGLDFSDDMARMVVCVGVPFRPLTSWSVSAQREYNGEEWYVDDALCAVNQAVGRCLRHAKDYGAIILLDIRYTEPYYQSKLSRWCKEVVSIHSSVTTLTQALQERYSCWAGVPSTTSIHCLHKSESTFESKVTEMKSAGSESTNGSDFSILSAPGHKMSTPSPVTSHILASAAIKLLYEQTDRTTKVDASGLRFGIRELEENFF